MIRFRGVAVSAALSLLSCASSFAACSYSASPLTDVIAGNRGAGGTVSVMTGGGCTWTATAFVQWITLDDGAGSVFTPVTGPGSFHYNVLSNQQWGARSTGITIGEDGQPPFAGVNVLQRGYKNVYLYEGSLESFIDRDSTTGAYSVQTLKTDSGCAVCISGLNNVWGHSTAGPAEGMDPHPAWALEATATFRGKSSGASGGLYRRNHSTGQNLIDLPQMCGRMPCVPSIQLPGLPNPDYEMAATGDFDGDGNPDILWRNPVTGATAIWLLSNTFGAPVTVRAIANLDNLPANFKLSGVYDFNNDGMDDILWRNTANGYNAVFIMNGSVHVSTVNLEAIPNSAYYVGAVADYDNDGQPDILWRNDTTNQLAIWKMNGTTHVTTIDLAPESGISVAGPR